MSCSHHACKTAIRVEELYHTCSLCREPTYCSDECRLMDWPIHDCVNARVIQTELPVMPQLRPYYYEDYLSAEELAALPITDPIFQQRAYLHANANRNMTYYVEANAVSENGRMPAARGLDPRKGLAGAKMYELSLVFNSGGNSAPFGAVTLVGAIPKHMIFAGNTENAKANAIAGGKGIGIKKAFQSLRRRLYAKNESYIFWPSQEEVKGKFAVKNLPSQGDVIVTLSVSGRTVSTLSAGYELQKTADGFARNMARSIKEKLRQALKLKFDGTTVDTKKLQVLSYADNEGNGVMLTFHVDGARNELVDVEYMANNRQVEGTISEPIEQQEEAQELVEEVFTCNAHNVNDVVALAMALDTHLATTAGMAAQPELELYAGIIKNHAYALQQDANAAPSAQVGVAIAAALDVLHANIGASAATWKGYNTVELIQKTETFLRRFSGSGSKLKNMVVTRYSQRELHHVQHAIERKLGTPLSSSAQMQLESLLTRVKAQILGRK